MNRLGFTDADVQRRRARLQALPHVRLAALMTHFAGADRTEPGAIDEQMRRFQALAADWRGAVCVANSAALFLHPNVAGDGVRPGIALYGASPATGSTAAALGLEPAMSLRAQIIAIQSVARGAAVGYGSRWVAPRSSRIGVVACGYADGYPRSAPDGTPVWVAGTRVPLAGQVSMDMITVDLTDAPQATVGAEVELWGTQIPVDEVAQRAGTIGYELLCALAPRVPVVEVDAQTA
jgi:alanine racemase